MLCFFCVFPMLLTIGKSAYSSITYIVYTEVLFVFEHDLSFCWWLVSRNGYESSWGTVQSLYRTGKRKYFQTLVIPRPLKVAEFIFCLFVCVDFNIACHSICRLVSLLSRGRDFDLIQCVTYSWFSFLLYVLSEKLLLDPGFRYEIWGLCPEF